MKVRAECIPCNLDRAKFECDLAMKDEKKKMEVMKELLLFIHDNLDTIPAFIGTERERMVKRKSGIHDPYRKLKIKADETAKKLLPYAKKFFLSESDKLLAILRIIAVANSMEYGVKDYEFDPENFRNSFIKILGKGGRGNPSEAKKLLQNYKKILYLMDNCGESIFDYWAATWLEKNGKKVIFAPKRSPVLNDATVADLRRIGCKIEILPCGSSVGINFQEASNKFRRIFWDRRYLLLAKGMGHYEVLSEMEEELRGRLIYILRAKCEPVADSIGVKKGELVILAV